MFAACLLFLYGVGIWAVVEVALSGLGTTQSRRVTVLSLAIVSGAVVPWLIVRAAIEAVQADEC